MDATGLGFPFRINEFGQVETGAGDENIRAKVLQVLLTSPGERVHLPEFGCGLRDLVFDPNNEILAATTEFMINRALQQWLDDEIVVQSVDVIHQDVELQIEIVYLRRDRIKQDKVKIAF